MDNFFFYLNYFLNMESKSEENIKILSYNILAQSLLSDSLHKSNEEIDEIDYLQLDYRFNKIFEKIVELEPDICLFQEFEQNGKLKQLFNSKNLSYDIIFKKRPGEHEEGCAIAYNKKKFRLEYYCALELRSENLKNKKFSKKKGSPNLFNKENVATMIVLESYQTSFYYLIICSHLLFNNNRGDIKLGQIYQIIQSALLIKKYYKDIPITTIFGGDLNSSPNSAIYEYITKNELNVEFLLKNNLSGQTNQKYISTESLYDENSIWYKEIINTYPKFDNNKIILLTKKYNLDDSDDEDNKIKLILENKMCMKSFYKEKNGTEPKMTCLSGTFKGTFDFLFYNTSYTIDIKRVLDIPEIDVNYISIPDKNNPSDHYPLFVEFNIHN